MSKIASSFPSIILASSSIVRKQQLIDANIPFEIIISDADETPDESKTFKDQLAEISMRKALTVLEATKNRGKRVIIAADQNLMFNEKMYGKPKSIDDARKLLHKMKGSEEIYSYTGNSVLLADGKKILQSINITDTAKLCVDSISDEEIENYLMNNPCLSFCGGISILYSSFVHLKEGRLSTAKGLTLEYALEMISNI